jgi:hypothetical protein
MTARMYKHTIDDRTHITTIRIVQTRALRLGHKQTGKAAVAAKNVFCHLTYADAVDLESISDHATRQSVEDQIAHFGQTPARLFSNAHPKRKPLLPSFTPTLAIISNIGPNPDS